MIVSPGPVSSFSVSAPTTAIAATGFPVTVTANDRSATPSPIRRQRRYHDQQRWPARRSAVADGVHQKARPLVNVALATADTVTLTVSAGAIQQTSGSIVVSPPPRRGLSSAAPGSATAGARI